MMMLRKGRRWHSWWTKKWRPGAYTIDETTPMTMWWTSEPESNDGSFSTNALQISMPCGSDPEDAWGRNVYPRPSSRTLQRDVTSRSPRLVYHNLADHDIGTLADAKESGVIQYDLSCFWSDHSYVDAHHKGRPTSLRWRYSRSLKRRDNLQSLLEIAFPNDFSTTLIPIIFI